MSSILQPATLQELAGVVRSSGVLRIEGAGTGRSFKVVDNNEGPLLSIQELKGVIDFSPDDQVVNVRAGTTLADLQADLRQHGQCIPYQSDTPNQGTVAGLLSLNLPHYLEAECGTWRDWVLGTTVVQADGIIAKSGSHAVKNVAGYDLHKLCVGSRGTLFVVAEVILRTFPIKSLPQPTLIRRGEAFAPNIIQRVLPTAFDAALATITGPVVAYPGTSTLWYQTDPDVTRYPGDWIIRSGQGNKNVEITDPTVIKYMRRAKQIFDPTGKLNPGEMGIF